MKSSTLNNRRLQALIRKQRRSFVFNAGWWVAIASSIDGKGITPWIVAGDDTVLASNSDDENVIQDLLTTFQKNLQINSLTLTQKSQFHLQVRFIHVVI